MAATSKNKSRRRSEGEGGGGKASIHERLGRLVAGMRGNGPGSAGAINADATLEKGKLAPDGRG